VKIKDSRIVITGGAAGIGAALARRFSAAGAKQIVIVDRDAVAAQQVAADVVGLSASLDVCDETALKELVDRIETEEGAIDLFVSNAGAGKGDGDPWWATSASNDDWNLLWQLHVMAHVYAARACLPHFLARKSGWFLNTASAAGLLNQIGDAAYSTTKHAAIGFAESLAITHGDDGVGVSVLAPQAVATGLIGMADGQTDIAGVLTPEQVAETVVVGLERRDFMILPHPEVKKFFAAKADNYERWVGGMRKLRRQSIALNPESGIRLPVSQLKEAK
jgi:NAD(P)-dependent dehydrogenase (short-subunit alcohol dehydrogenase family)